MTKQPRCGCSLCHKEWAHNRIRLIALPYETDEGKRGIALTTACPDCLKQGARVRIDDAGHVTLVGYNNLGTPENEAHQGRTAKARQRSSSRQGSKYAATERQ